MRKLVALSFCFILLAAAAPAKAASQIEFEGTLMVLHHNLYNFNRASEKDFAQTDSFFENRLHFGVDFKPSEDILVHWSFRSPDTVRWGVANQGTSNAAEVWTRAIYATITQPWGALSIGRLEEDFPTAHQGLSTLGYSYGGDWLYSLPFDNSEVADGISFTKKFDNGFGINAYYAKSATGDPDNTTANRDVDVDLDRYGIEPFYEWDGGGAALHIQYRRDMTDPTVDKNYAFFVNPAIMQTWGPFSLRFEGNIGWGETEFDIPNTPKVKEKGLGLYVEANYNYGAGDVNLIAWYADGTSWRDRDVDGRTQHELVDMGDFAPFLVAYYGVTLGDRVSTWDDANNVLNGGGSAMSYGGVDRSVLGSGTNHWGIGLLGNHSLTDAIKLNYGIGYFELVKEYWEGQNKHLGVEVDLGVHIQLLDNLTFESQFGYMFNGDANANARVTQAGRWFEEDAKDTYAWLSALTVSF
jgi:hypothetical protein